MEAKKGADLLLHGLLSLGHPVHLARHRRAFPAQLLEFHQQGQRQRCIRPSSLLFPVQLVGLLFLPIVPLTPSGVGPRLSPRMAGGLTGIPDRGDPWRRALGDDVLRRSGWRWPSVLSGTPYLTRAGRVDALLPQPHATAAGTLAVAGDVPEAARDARPRMYYCRHHGRHGRRSGRALRRLHRLLHSYSSAF